MLQTPGTTVELIEGSGGVFEIIIDDALVFSKKKLGRFPTDDEVAVFAGSGTA